MTEYRPGGCWKRTLVKVGTQPPDEQGRRPDDELVGMVDDPELAARIAELLTLVEAVCDCGHEGLGLMFHLVPCPVAVLRHAARRR
jgi:hypothetical protein